MLRCASIVVLTLATPTVGQQYSYSPDFLRSVEGAYHTGRFGLRQEMRYQMLDGELRNQSLQLKGVALRLNEFTGWKLARGRSWSKVELRITTADRTKFGQFFDRNPATTPTLVFSGTVSWPTMNNTLPTRPDPWGGKTGAYRHPFRSAFAYDGKQDVLLDWRMTGGRLHNNIAWNKYNVFPYEFDAPSDGSIAKVAWTRYIPDPLLNNNSPGVTARCNDSTLGSWSTRSAFVRCSAYVHGPKPKDPRYKNRLALRSESYYTARDALVIHAWSQKAYDKGIDVGTGCNRLHVLPGYTFIPLRTNKNTYAQTPEFLQVWKPLFAGTKLTVQAGWTDSATNRFALTAAMEMTLPMAAPGPRAVERRAIYTDDVRSLVGTGPSTDGFENPALRYAR